MALFSWDTETFLIQPGLLSPPIVCHSFAKDSAMQEHTPMLLRKGTGTYEIKLLLERGHTVAGANIAYDFGCLLAEKPDLFPLVWKAYEEGRVWDVQIAATLVAIAEGRLRDGELFDRKGQKMKDGKGRMTSRYSLDNCVREWLGRDNAKSNDRFRMSYALLENVPMEYWPDDAKQYPIDDAVNTLEVAEAQKAWATQTGFDFTDLKVQCHAAFCAHLSAMVGLRTDGEKVAKLKGELLERQKTLCEWARNLGFLRVNKDGSYSRETKPVAARVHRAYLGQPPTTPKGAISLSRETLEEAGDPDLEKFAEIGKVQKYFTYFPSLEQAAVAPLNVRPNILLSTGRASFEGILQLLPRKGGLRECFRARGTYVSVDYAAVELSTLAQVCLWTVGSSKLAEAINAGIDPHSLMGSNMNGMTMTYGEFFKNKKKPEIADLRQAAKAANFGYPGMMGAPKFVIAKRKEGNSVCNWIYRDDACGAEKVLKFRGKTWDGGPLCKRCIDEAAKLKKTYLATWPEITKYWDWVMKELDLDDKLTQFVSKRVRGGLNGPQGANTLFQGLAADGAKRAVIALTKEMYLEKSSPLYGSRLCVFAHDETIIDVPSHMDLHDAAFRQRDIMVEEMQKVCPDVKISAEPAAMKNWWKQAEPCYNSANRLIPWQPKDE